MEFAKNQVKLKFGWSTEYTNKVVLEFERFLLLKKDYEDCSPSDDVDAFWHQVILDTRFYFEYCMDKFGGMIHHSPQNALDQEARVGRLHNTLKLYRQVFKEEPDPDVWYNEGETCDNSIQIFIAHEKTLALQVKPNATILELKEKLNEILAIPLASQRILFNGRQLDNEKSLIDYHIVKNSTLHLLLRVKGC